MESAHDSIMGMISWRRKMQTMERMKLEDARALGLLGKARIKTSRGHVARAKGDASRTTSNVGMIQHYSVSPCVNPQDMLYLALVTRLGKNVVQTEVTGLVPGRKYRADIYIPSSKIVVEVDGFAYHKSKSAFQKDRERQNDFMASGYRVYRYYTRQILCELGAVVDQIIGAHTMCINAEMHHDSVA